MASTQQTNAPAQISSPSTDLDPAIWSGLPNEILFLIITESNAATQKSWACTCSAFSTHACSKIWHTVRLHGIDLNKYSLRNEPLRYLDEEPGQPLAWDGIIRQLIHNPIRSLRGSRLTEDLPSKPKKGKGKKEPPTWGPPVPGSHVRVLEIDNRIRPAREDALALGLSSLLRWLPYIRALLYDGQLLPQRLSMMATAQNLRKLCIRVTRDVCKRPDGSYPPGSFWLDRTLDFSSLLSLTNLQSLLVGRLKLQEAKSLAEVVSAMKLKFFTTSSRGWIKQDGNRRLYPTVRDSASPLLLFLHYLSNAGGFPATVTSLSLIDEFHTKTSALFQFIYRAITPCEELTHLGAVFRLDVDAARALQDIGLRPFPARHIFADWRHLACDEEVVVKVMERGPSGRLQEKDESTSEIQIKNLANTIDGIVASKENLGAATTAQSQNNSRMSMISLLFVRNAKLPRHKIVVYSSKDVGSRSTPW